MRFENNGPGTDFWKTAERINTYDENDNLIFRELKGYNAPNQTLYWRGGFYEYDATNLLKKYSNKRYNPDVNLWITISWTEYKYDANGCRNEATTFSNVGGMITRRVTYTHNENCQMTSEKTEWLSNGFDLDVKDLYTRTYYADGRSYDETLFKKSFLADTLYTAYQLTNILTENENTIEFYQTVFNSDQDTLYSSKIFYEYDEFENVTLSTTYLISENTNGWELSRQRFYENEYDVNDFLIGKKTEQWHYDEPNPPHENLYFRQDFSYKNSCEGINEEYTVSFEDTGRENRYEYIYQGMNDCLELNKIDLQITVSPNPSNGEFKISSPIFQTGNTDILIFSLDGKVLLQKNEKSRSESSFIDLRSMQNGIYILQLQNGKHFVNEKIVIAN